MSTPRLSKSIVRALLVLAVAAAGIATAPAQAKDKGAKAAKTATTDPANLALAAPAAPKPAALVDKPRATDDAPAKKSGGTSWLPWIVLAVGAAAVGAAIFVVNGSKDPACPSGRVCQ